MVIYSTILFLSDLEERIPLYLEDTLQKKTNQIWVVRQEKIEKLYDKIKSANDSSLIIFKPYVLFFNDVEMAKLKINSLSNIAKIFNKRVFVLLTYIPKEIKKEFVDIFEELFEKVIDVENYKVSEEEKLSDFISDLIVDSHSQGNKWRMNNG